MLRSIISDLTRNAEIEGAVLLDEEETVIISDLPNGESYIQNIQNLISGFEDWESSSSNGFYNLMFKQFSSEFNGYKIISKRIKNGMTLMVMMGKKGYTSLAMLDIENSTRKIEEIIQLSERNKILN
jgi:hypothetical protein